MWRRLMRFPLARTALVLLGSTYAVTFVAPFVAPYALAFRDSSYAAAPPMTLRFYSSETGFVLRPFVCGLSRQRDQETLRLEYAPDCSQRYPLRLFVHGDEYRMWGLIPSSLHLFGVSAPGRVFVLGTDMLGRDLFSRVLIGGQVSLSVGLVGVAITVVLGALVGLASGYYGGAVDNALQRLIEVLMSFPSVPLWMVLAAALPESWSPLQTYLAVVCILALIGWTSLARQLRGLVLSLRESELVVAAKALGGSEQRILLKHLLPQTFSHIIVVATLAIPGTILAESALSFLGLGLQPPFTSWGVLLQDAQGVENLVAQPWLATPAFFIIWAVLLWNFVGDGLRDAADPHAR